MRYASIRKMDIANGEGIRVSLFVQGCDFHCKNCFNQQTWSWSGGKEYTPAVQEQILKLCEPFWVKGLSILGGEPLHPNNRSTVSLLVMEFKERYPGKTVWLWTGYKYEDVKDLPIMNYIDVLIDGQYIDELHDFRLQWRGSSNQRVINLKKKENERRYLEHSN